MKNREIAGALNEIADMMEMKHVRWKPRAYRTAARKIEGMNKSVEEIYREEGSKGLEEIHSVGKRLAEHIEELIKSGKVKKWERLKKESESGLHELIKLEGLGPRKVKELRDKLNIKDMDDLKTAIKDNKIRSVKGFGMQTEKNLKQSIEHYDKSHERMLLGKAWAISIETINHLKENAEIDQIDYAGSLRRMKETIGDIDLLAVTKKVDELMKSLTSMPDTQRVLVKGRTKTSVVLKSGIQVDLRTIDKKSYGAALMYFTGNKDHNIELRKIASKKDYKLSEYGLHKKKKQVAGKTEEEVYKTLGLRWIAPELREMNGEIEAARKDKLPNLIQNKDIKGDLQMHTTYSDGHDSIRAMVKKAKHLGYDYIAITDHSKSERIAKGMDERKIRKQWKEIAEVAKAENFHILRGAEVNILEDGLLDYDDELLNDLDIVLASVHSRFKSTRKAMTERILRGVSNKHVNVLAHPTGRMIHKREGYEADFETIFSKCRKEHVAVEINADPARLDLNDRMIRSASEHEVKFSIGTDSHSKDRLENMKFGLGQARRGWLQKKDVINTMTYTQLMNFLKK